MTSMGASPDDSEVVFARIIEFERTAVNAAAARRERCRWGVALSNPDFPSVWDLNFLSIERPDRDISVTRLIEESERVQDPAGMAHRKAVIWDPALGTRLAPGFRDRGWRVKRFVTMALRCDPGPPVGDLVRECGWHEYRQFAEASSREFLASSERSGATMPAHAGGERRGRAHPDSGADIVRQLTDRIGVVARAVPTRYFGVRADGRIVSGCLLYSDGATAQVEDVVTLEPYRRRGYAGACVRAAVAAAAGHDLVFLVADDDDWPKNMYERLGFEPVGFYYDFLLEPGIEAGDAARR